MQVNDTYTSSPKIKGFYTLEDFFDDVKQQFKKLTKKSKNTDRCYTVNDNIDYQDGTNHINFRLICSTTPICVSRSKSSNYCKAVLISNHDESPHVLRIVMIAAEYKVSLNTFDQSELRLVSLENDMTLYTGHLEEKVNEAIPSPNVYKSFPLVSDLDDKEMMLQEMRKQISQSFASSTNSDITYHLHLDKDEPMYRAESSYRLIINPEELIRIASSNQASKIILATNRPQWTPEVNEVQRLGPEQGLTIEVVYLSVNISNFPPSREIIRLLWNQGHNALFNSDITVYKHLDQGFSEKSSSSDEADMKGDLGQPDEIKLLQATLGELKTLFLGSSDSYQAKRPSEGMDELAEKFSHLALQFGSENYIGSQDSASSSDDDLYNNYGNDAEQRGETTTSFANRFSHLALQFGLENYRGSQDSASSSDDDLYIYGAGEGPGGTSSSEDELYGNDAGPGGETSSTDSDELYN